MKTTKSITFFLAVLMLAAGFGPVWAEQQTVHERMLHHRAIDALVWAMPLMNFKQFRDGHKALGVDYVIEAVARAVSARDGEGDGSDT